MRSGMLENKKMDKIAFLFPGVGVTLHGREKQFFDTFETLMAPFLDQASDAAGVDLTRAFLDNSLEQCSPLCVEFFSYGFSSACHRIFEEKGYSPAYVAGHSMGIYGALAATQVIGYSDGLQICAKAHDLGEELLKGGKRFGVGVVIGLSYEELQERVANPSFASLKLANYNNDTSSVWVGLRQEVKKFLQAADVDGALKTIFLNIDIPFHTSFFSRELLERFSSFLEAFSWHEPNVPFVSTLDHRLLKTGSSLKEMTIQNLSQPIYWPQVLLKLKNLGVTTAMECGPGISLSQHSRFVEGAPRHLNMKNLRRRFGY